MARTRSQFHHGRAAGIDARDVPWIATLLAFAALCVAWLAQYGFGLIPCELCHLQRYGYWAAIAMGVFAVAFSRSPGLRKFWLGLMALALLGVVGIAVFQVGVEQGWWQGTAACVGTASAGMSNEELLNAINNAPVTRCDEAAFVLFGISMAGYSAIYALLLAVFALWGATRKVHR
ncbi:MAG TPA: disulfide bond formation protein B [Candidatus Binatia bacterium]|nr:disulfide bond formation protein B [Candidatus Binatia bacterium]